MHVFILNFYGTCKDRFVIFAISFVVANFHCNTTQIRMDECVLKYYAYSYINNVDMQTIVCFKTTLKIQFYQCFEFVKTGKSY